MQFVENLVKKATSIVVNAVTTYETDVKRATAGSNDKKRKMVESIIKGGIAKHVLPKTMAEFYNASKGWTFDNSALLAFKNELVNSGEHNDTVTLIKEDIAKQEAKQEAKRKAEQEDSGEVEEEVKDKQEGDEGALVKALAKEFKPEDNADTRIIITKNKNNNYDISQGLFIGNHKQGRFVEMLNVDCKDLAKSNIYNCGTYKDGKKHGVHVTIKEIKGELKPFNNYYRDGEVVLLGKKAPAKKKNFIRLNRAKVKYANQKDEEGVELNDARIATLNEIKKESRKKWIEAMKRIKEAELKLLQKSSNEEYKESFAYKASEVMPRYIKSYNKALLHARTNVDKLQSKKQQVLINYQV